MERTGKETAPPAFTSFVSRMDRQLGIFAKYWEPGSVKTRLAATIGDRQASCIYREFLVVLLDRLAGLGDRHVLAFWPPERRTEFAQMAGPRWSLSAQSTGSLGSRMRDYFDQAFTHGARRVILLGSDSPTLPLELVTRAWSLLDDHPVVLGPTRDGGYYLIGLNESLPPIFDQVAWGTARVWQQTVDQLHQARITFAQLPAWYDVDTWNDLVALGDDIATLAENSTIWKPLRAAVDAATKKGSTKDKGRRTKQQ